MENIMTAYNLNGNDSAELAEYCRNRFRASDDSHLPAAGASVPEAWNRMISCSDMFGVPFMINSNLCRNHPVDFFCPESVKMEVFSSFAGDIPIIYAEDERDFEQLVTNIVYKGNRPENIAETGSSFVSGKRLRFIILSSKPYSNVTSEEIGLSGEEWRNKSMLIRRSHECTHFFTKQVYGSAHNNLHDELMADFIGLYDAFGFYRADWFLRFMGLIPGNGNRISVYTEGLSPSVREAVAGLGVKAAYELERWSKTSQFAEKTHEEMIKAMCRAGISGMINGELLS